MNNKDIVEEMRKYRISPGSERKMEFFRHLGEMGLLNRRYAVVSHKDFLAVQLFYIEKWIWAVSGLLLLFITWICSRYSGPYSFALTPLLAASILFETRRSRRWNMAELEQAARFSGRSVLLARIFLLGAINTAGLMIVILAVRSFSSFSLIRVFLYMMVPYLTASLLGSVYERRNREDQGWGSVLICIFSSLFFASVSVFFDQLYEERMIVFWASVFMLMTCALAVSIWKSPDEKEEPAWN